MQVGGELVDGRVVVEDGRLEVGAVLLVERADHLKRAGGVESEAIKRDRQVAVTLGGSVASWCAGARSAVDPAPGSMAGPATACDCTSATSCLIGTDRTVVDGSEFRGVNISAVGGTVTFDGKLGTLTNLTPTAITLSGPDARFQLRVAVGATGLSSICVPTGAGFISGIPSCP